MFSTGPKYTFILSGMFMMLLNFFVQFYLLICPNGRRRAHGKDAKHMEKKHAWKWRGWVSCVVSLCLGSTVTFYWAQRIHATGATGMAEFPLLSSSVNNFSFEPEIPDLKDDPTCLSRTQQNLYRSDKERLIIPAALIEAWERYGDLYRSCSVGRNWTDVFLDQESGGSSNCKYLVYLEMGVGLGNKILALTSALLYALSTDRVLLLDYRTQNTLSRLLCEPFANSTWVLPWDFPYEKFWSAPSLGGAMELNWNVRVMDLRLSESQTSEDQLFFCEETQSGISKVQWVSWMSNQYYVTELFKIPSIWRRVNPIFNFRGETAFTYLSRLIILPNNDIWGHIIRTYWGYLATTRLRVGLQVRLHWRSDRAAFDEQVQQVSEEATECDGIVEIISEEDESSEEK
ncbi:hypothetical protein R1sor_005959 [Riccia sorocarpa]|uniref:Fucosyltransferase n=1 Tax=Riccia sorocarpa TaxID=122646 RepID=A0ABD3HLN9_9MARC